MQYASKRLLQLALRRAESQIVNGEEVNLAIAVWIVQHVSNSYRLMKKGLKRSGGWESDRRLYGVIR